MFHTDQLPEDLQQPTTIKLQLHHTSRLRLPRRTRPHRTPGGSLGLLLRQYYRHSNADHHRGPRPHTKQPRQRTAQDQLGGVALKRTRFERWPGRLQQTSTALFRATNGPSQGPTPGSGNSRFIIAAHSPFRNQPINAFWTYQARLPDRSTPPFVSPGAWRSQAVHA